LVAAKHVMRYLKGTLDYGLRYVTDHEFGLYVYSNSYWDGNILSWKSTSTYLFSLAFSMVSSSSRKKLCVALSMAEVEYVAVFAARREAMWLQKLLIIRLNFDL
jgi:hypothetical protein